jgi:hypothetical protein
MISRASCRGGANTLKIERAHPKETRRGWAAYSGQEYAHENHEFYLSLWIS